MAYIRQCDKLSEALYVALVGCHTKAIMYVCSTCHREGSVAEKLLWYEVERTETDPGWGGGIFGVSRPPFRLNLTQEI